MARDHARPDAERAKVAELLLRGLTTDQIQRATDIPRATISRWMRQIRHRDPFPKPSDWVDIINDATNRVTARLVEMIESATGAATPEMVHAIAGALKILGEIGVTARVIDARHARPSDAAGTTLVALDRREDAG